MSWSLLVPVGDIADELKERFVASAKNITVGNGLDPLTGMGPAVSAAHKERVLGYIALSDKDYAGAARRYLGL